MTPKILWGDDAEMEEIIQDISNQNKTNKRDRSNDEVEEENLREEVIRQRQSQSLSNSNKSQDENDEDDELNEGKIMNSTPNTWENTDNSDLQRSKNEDLNNDNEIIRELIGQKKTKKNYHE